MISIVVPCYNVEKTIKRTIDCLLSQTDSDYRIVLVDDGSTDYTPNICDEYAASHERISVIHQKNVGLMGAWIAGVKESSCDYVVFCDADDYIEEDLIYRIGKVIDDHHPDIILYGMTLEYDNGDKAYSSNKLHEGYYDRQKIAESILPSLYSDGNMHSEKIIKSRCVKAFKKSLLDIIIPELNNNVSVGEDQLTTFSALQCAESIYCIEDYHPYHYIRNTGSMIGAFDENIFQKVDLLYSEMTRLAKHYGYEYLDQILYDRLSVSMTYLKKYICKAPYDYSELKKRLITIRESDGIIKCFNECSIKKYSLGAKVVTFLFMKRRFLCLYVLLKSFEMIRGRNV